MCIYTVYDIIIIKYKDNTVTVKFASMHAINNDDNNYKNDKNDNNGDDDGDDDNIIVQSQLIYNPQLSRDIIIMLYLVS